MVVSGCVPSANIADLCQLGDKIMIEEVQSSCKKPKGMIKGVAFPTCISVNKKICHVSPVSGATVLSENDTVRIEMASHVDGFIGAMAHTLVVTNESVSGRIADVIAAGDTARKEIVRRVLPGMKKKDLFVFIEESVEGFMCKIHKWRCNQLKQFAIGGDDENDDFKLNKVYSVDLLISSEKTKLEEMDDTNTDVFKLSAEDQIQLNEEIPGSYVLINKKFQQMPFNNRALAELGINDITPLRSAGMVERYPVLSVEDDVAVVHFKFTMYVTKECVVDKTYHKVQKLHRPKADVLLGAKDTERDLIYCGSLPLAENGLGVIPAINDVSWNLHPKYKAEMVLACTGSFGTYMFRRSNGSATLEDLEHGWSKLQLCSIPGILCEWCPREGNIIAFSTIDRESNTGKIYLVDCLRPGAAPVFAHSISSGPANTLSWSKHGVYLLTTFHGSNAFVVLTRKLRSLETKRTYVEYRKLKYHFSSRHEKADYYGVFHPTLDIFFVASSAGILMLYTYEAGDKGAKDGFYMKNSFDLFKSLHVPEDLGFLGISISKSGDKVTCLRSDGCITVLTVHYEDLREGVPIFTRSNLVIHQDSLPHVNLAWTGASSMLTTVDATELVTVYCNTEMEFGKLCDNKADINCAKRCHRINNMDWHAQDILASSSEDGFVHFWSLVNTTVSPRFAKKTRNTFQERMFYQRKQLQYGLGGSLAEQYKEIVNALGQVANTSSARINLLEEKNPEGCFSRSGCPPDDGAWWVVVPGCSKRVCRKNS